MKAKALAPLKNYDTLRNAVTRTLLQGQKKIEALKVAIYWNTGNLIHEYLRTHSDTSAMEISTQLSQDLHVERSLFYRVLQFAEAFPKVAARRLSWTHYRELLTVPDAAKRNILARETMQRGWSVRRLEREIVKRRELKGKGSGQATSSALLEPTLGQRGVRKTKFLVTVSGRKTLVVDLGFHNYKELPPSSGFLEKECVTWNEKKKTWVRAGTKEDLYVYDGKVERVVDGDTLLVHVELGFGLKRRQYLRLRGLNAREITQAKVRTGPSSVPPTSAEARASAEGRKARDFLLRIFSKHPACRFKSRFTDKYDRYISDLWHGNRFLNQELLDRGLAVKVDG